MAVKRKKTSRSAASIPGRGAKPVKRAPAKAAARKPAAPARKQPMPKPAPKSAVAKPRPSKVSAMKMPAVKAAAKASPSKARAEHDAIKKTVEAALDDMKAVNIKVLDVRKLTDIADTLIIASGNSDRHVRSIADRVIQFAKRDGFRPTGVEGERDGEWVLVDLRDVIVHIMLPRIREFYRLEDLWDVSAARREAAATAAEKA